MGGIEAGIPVARGVVVPEVVMPATGPDEKVGGEHVQAHHDTRCVVVVGSGIDAAVEVKRREDHSAAGHRIVPVAVDINIATAGPDMAGRHPGPVRAQQVPITGAPHVAGLRPHPVPRNPRVVHRRGGDVRTDIDAARRSRGKVGDLGGLAVRPVAGGPLVFPVAKVVPIARHPLAVRRQVPPDAADPEEIVPVVVPAPVARNPGHVIPLGLLLGRELFDGFRRCDTNDQAGLRLEADRLGKGLVDRPAGEDLDVLRDLHIGILSHDSRRKGECGGRGERG